jgi:hypothetical protein
MSAPTYFSLKAAQHPETCYHVAVVFQMFHALHRERTQQFVPINCKQFFGILDRLVVKEYGGWSRQRYRLLHQSRAESMTSGSRQVQRSQSSEPNKD